MHDIFYRCFEGFTEWDKLTNELVVKGCNYQSRTERVLEHTGSNAAKSNLIKGETNSAALKILNRLTIDGVQTKIHRKKWKQ